MSFSNQSKKLIEFGSKNSMFLFDFISDRDSYNFKDDNDFR